MKIYKKNGRKNYTEKRMVDKLAKYFEGNPEAGRDVAPANNEAELRAMYNRYIPEDVEYTETNKEPMAKTNKAESEIEVETATFEDIDDDNNQIVDPFNRENPIVRDYVLGKDALGREAIQGVDPNQRFAEPTTFEEAFEIPDLSSDENGEEPKKENKGSFGSKKSEGRKESTPRPQPVNPHFDDMSSGKKKRSSKKFAKYIVEAIAMLSHKGFVWFATKDINPSKLAEYELNGEMDLSLLVTLSDGQQATIKEFFQSQCIAAEQLSQFTDEEKQDLTDALTEVLLEKGAAPTPQQELILMGLTIIGGKIIALMTIKAQTNSLLEQLKAMKQGGGYESAPEPEPIAPPQAAESRKAEPQSVAYEETNFEDIDKIVSGDSSETELEKVIETIE